MSILDRYLTRRYLRTFMLCLSGTVGLLLFVDFFEHLGDFAKYRSAAGLIAEYFALEVPKITSSAFPAASLISMLVSIGSLGRTNQLIAMHASGVSTMRIGRPLFITGLVLSLLIFAWNEIVVPPATSRARTVKDFEIKNLDTKGLLDAKAIWLLFPEGVLQVDYYDAVAQTLSGITVHFLDDHFRLIRVIDIPRAIWRKDRWELVDAIVRIYGADGDVPFRSLKPEEFRITNTPEEFWSRSPHSDEFNIRQLAERIRTLNAKGLDPVEYQVDLQLKMALPFSGLIAVLLGFPLAIRTRPRHGGVAQHLGTALAVCFGYWLTQALSASAGRAGTLPPVLAAWAANALFVLVAGLLGLRT